METSKECDFIVLLESTRKQFCDDKWDQTQRENAAKQLINAIELSRSEGAIRDGCDLLSHIVNSTKNEGFDSTFLQTLLNSLILKLLNVHSTLHIQSSLLKCFKCVVKNWSTSKGFDVEVLVSVINNVNRQINERFNEKSDDLWNELLWTNVILNSVRVIKCSLTFCDLTIPSQKSLNTILGFLKVFSFYGLAGYNVKKASVCPIFASPLNQYIPDELESSPVNRNHRNQRKRKPRQKRQHGNDDNDDNSEFSAAEQRGASTPSESEQSTAEYSKLNAIDLKAIIKQNSLKIRIACYESLCAVVKKVEKRTLFGYWSSFIPDSSGIGTTEFSVITTVLKDPSAKVRYKALYFLHELLLYGKNYVFTLIEGRKSQSKHPFTTVSQTLAGMIVELHRASNLILFAETNNEVLLHALKFLSSLIAVTPYNKLDDGLMSVVLNKSIVLMNSESLQNSCLAFFVNVFSLKPAPNALIHWCSSTEGKQHIELLLYYSFKKSSTLDSISQCNESLIFLSTFLDSGVKHESINITKVLNLAINISCHEVTLINPVLQSLVCKYLQSVALYIKSMNSIEVTDQERVINFWHNIFKTRLMCDFQESSTHIPSSSVTTIIDFISAVRSDTFELFEAWFKHHLISLIINKVKSETTISNQASAVRCLGVFLSFPSLIEDLSFVMDTTFICRDLISQFPTAVNREKHPLIHQSLWSFANVNDTLKKFYLNNEEITVDFLLENGRLSMQVLQLKMTSIVEENVHTNVVRCLSSLMQLLLQPERHALNKNAINCFVVEVTSKLISFLNKTKSFKLQWNVCSAFSSLLSNECYLLVVCEHLILVNEMQVSLFNAITSSKSHKVQAFAVDALCTSEKRMFYLFDLNIEQIFDSISKILVERHSLVLPTIRNIWVDKLCNALHKLTYLFEPSEEQIKNLLPFFEYTEINNEPAVKMKQRLMELNDYTTIVHNFSEQIRRSR
ncbi:HEAT repeat-containing protein 6-like isoform X1 [Leptotrombidium deliense]|uniref:HEAT repeat-containing protein 6-like isoform X1 n=1 Tax=Leptotrombidium deliense TaxID=299467 RepID=A0A443SP88_9ACAR|nr:HEAT repeat-containing protein 6-like isoform X1 [Leptotrombidium deliense]